MAAFVPARVVDALLFDMDGVVVDSRRAVETAWHSMAARFGRTISAVEMERHVHGRVGMESVAELLPDLSPLQRRDVHEALVTSFRSGELVPIAGVLSLLTRVRSSGIPVALVTGASNVTALRVIRTFGLEDVFGAVVTQQDVHQGKPHPEPYLQACALLGVEADKTLVFEDALNGVRSAVAAGAHCWGVGSTVGLIEAGAENQIEDFQALDCEELPDGRLSIATDSGFRVGHGRSRHGAAPLISRS
ncbi:HAD family hydrolase [Streptomyces tendae]|uniref:HAD family hydrolase n=1 Tax=Streptomyces tendae TaxID=1932 RepID=UPI003D71AD1B